MDPTPKTTEAFELFRAVAKQIVNVPKAVIDRREKAFQQAQARKRQQRKAHA
jgi:hypothetical protein